MKWIRDIVQKKEREANLIDGPSEVVEYKETCKRQ